MSEITVECALKVLKESYGMIPERAERMNGYQHVNFKIALSGRDSTIEKFIMKFVDTTHFSYCGNTELQHAMLRHLRRHDIPTSFPVTAKDGGTIVEYLHGDKKYTVQMLSFVKGVSINEADLSASDVEIISRDMGKVLGSIHRTLMTLECDIKAASSVYSPYHVQNTLVFKDKLDYVKDKRMRKLLESCLESHVAKFLPRLGELRKGFIHGDFSDTNAILWKDQTGWKIEGIIDFEECCYGLIVGDLGICIAYVMMKASSCGADPVKAARVALQQYDALNPLTTPEREVLFDAATSRMFVSYVSASYELYINPENHKFIFTQAKGVPKTLQLIDELGREEVEKRWFEGI